MHSALRSLTLLRGQGVAFHFEDSICPIMKAKPDENFFVFEVKR